MAPLPKFSAVLFDCDGVLVDSESITNGVLHQMLQELGWQLSAEESIARFVGKMLRDEADVIEDHTGFRIDEEWMQEFRRRRNAQLEASLQAIPGVVDAVDRIAEIYPGRIACASGADRPKIELQLRKIGLFDAFEGRIFSGMEQPNSKPAPDVYLAAAESLQVDPAESAVIEDSPTGVIAGAAAGSHVLGFCPDSPVHQSAETLLAAGAAETFSAMDQLPGLLTE
ncbi:haloacid dehalogenase superfamily, subfamily IA, variant 3 with third motif having DD or ED [Brevibacterium iodinum ATCC 49514]|uniref:Haloacid dehalogenase superfamily, subfamily IA, variant 3 with third motif having DD or ED n=1 Tax=Brevibacterium iodinum ATCC 49514 TaxID=1255616 RepID=A0A2H1IT60_9MICO|nr:HAD family phosphatase [Brevibacterium iodinum]SMX78300.1 haloacid dehalogenase superfamily, subfamily IA, variant 3 with third motif having DD or ED [Brevibacterium iodinum ATCC 49514]SUW14156.1 Beta-phosphoglucomutase [Brevibacterium iodinum]